MIIDAHTHIFPSSVKVDRSTYLERDATFREMYSNPNTRIATAEELIVSMDEAGVDRSVICGFGWTDAELCEEHNEYLLETAAQSDGRLIAFCTIQPSKKGARDDVKRLAARGAHGLGELRPTSQGYSLIDSDEADLLSWAADAYDLVLLFHASEPVGHVYPGKKGLPVEQLGRFVADFPGVAVVGAHWGGGLPFYSLMPEMREAMDRTYVDTAATALLYGPDVTARVIDLMGAEKVLFGSDFPLVSQRDALQALRDAQMPEEARPLIEGGNAQELLRL